jgi:hypothetical protein
VAGQVAIRRGGQQSRIVAENLLVERLRRGRRPDPQLVVEPVAQLVVGRKGVGLAAARVARPHQPEHGLFPGREAAGQLLRGGHRLRMPAQLQQGVHPLLRGGQPQPVQPGRLGDGHVELGELGERVAPPPAQPEIQQVEGLPVVPGGGGGPRGSQLALELGGVQLVVGHGEPVAGGLVTQPVVALAERGAQPRHVGTQRAERTAGRATGPHRLDQPVVGNHRASVDEQDREHGPWFGAAEVDRPRVGLDHQWSEDLETHGDLAGLQAVCNPGRPQ